MVVLYNIIIQLYHFLLKVASLFNHKAKLWIDGRKGMWGRLEEISGKGDRIIWIHCSSLGEFEQGRPVIEQVKELHSGYKILITFFSPSGYQVRKNFTKADYVEYLPLDTRRNASRFLELVHPSMALFIKYEFWYHFLDQLKRRQIPIYLISANFRENQAFFKWYGSWYRKFLHGFRSIFVQNERSVELLRSIGITNTRVTGDTRFDRVKAIAQKSKDIPLAGSFGNNHFVLVAGSTWEKDELLLQEWLNGNGTHVKLIIAPHEIKKPQLDKLRSAFDGEAVFFSEADHERIAGARVLIIDNVGMLSSLYKYGNVAYVGGGFGKGIHNILEAATYDIPVLFGPNFQKFEEALDLVSLKGAFPVNSGSDLQSVMERFIQDPAFLKSSGAIAGNYVRQNIGATEAVLHILNEEIARLPR